MESQIITQVAKLLRQQAPRGERVEASKRDVVKFTPQDTVTLSHMAEALGKGGQSEFEKERGLKVEHYKSLVQNKRYEFTDKTVDQTAERIVKMLLG